jgi:hypothetical protein
MIKQIHKQEPKPANIVNFQKPAQLGDAAVPGDVTTGQESRYILKPVDTRGPLPVVMAGIARRLSESEREGYKYINQIAANSGEAVMVFERVK